MISTKKFIFRAAVVMLVGVNGTDPTELKMPLRWYSEKNSRVAFWLKFRQLKRRQRNATAPKKVRIQIEILYFFLLLRLRISHILFSKTKSLETIPPFSFFCHLCCLCLKHPNDYFITEKNLLSLTLVFF